jgi:oxygen-independent coproporphyrinogen-3 oxidase
MPSAEAARSYVDAVLSELRMRAYAIPEGFAGWTLYIGGGTPTTLGTELERLVGGSIGIMAGLGWGRPLEATVEANPGTISHRSAARIVAAGADRFSLGVQSMVDAELKAVGRMHSAEDAERAFDAMRYAGAKSVSIDIIAGLPGQDAESFARTLEAVAALSPDHVSCYGLTLEEGTPLFASCAEGCIEVPDDDAAADLLDMAAAWLKGMGLTRYEISNFAKPGHESLHNLIYWSDMPYIGVGAAAHSYDPDAMTRSWNVKGVEEYEGMIAETGTAEESREEISVERAMSDALILALRTSYGASLQLIEQRYGTRFGSDALNALAWAKANAMIEIGEGGIATLTDRGIMLSNSLFSKLV